MGIKFFGHYLLDEGKLTQEQLIEAIDYQAQHNPSLGELAVREGLITAKQADTINDKQRSLDKRFGEVAIDLGLLTDEQIVALLTLQKKEKVFFGEVILHKNFMTQAQLDQELANFEKEQKLEVVQLDDKIKAIDQEGILHEAVTILQTLYARIAHDPIKLVEVNEPHTRNGIICLQKMRGDKHLDFAIQTQDGVSMGISSKFLKMDVTEIDEMVLDVMNEFTNIVLGNIAVKLSVGSTKVNLAPPENIDASAFDTNPFHTFDFTTTHGNLTLFLKL